MRFWHSGAVVTGSLLAACSGAVKSDGETAGSGGAGGSAGSGGGSGSSGQPFLASESVARRLTQTELDNSLRDIFGDDTRPARTSLPEDPFDPFDNDYTLQVASAALIESLEVMAEDVADTVLGDAARRDALLPCTPSDAGDAACFRQVIEVLAGRAFRRPLVEEEITAYLTLLDFATEDNAFVNNDFYTAVHLLIRSLTQDPEFLYRIEVGTPTSTDGISALTSHEIATRMSYLLWGTTPSDGLLASAARDELTAASTRRTQVETMLEDPQAKEQLYRFHAMWLGYRAIPHEAALVAEFNRETTALIERVVFEYGNYLDLFTHPETHLTDTLADHYGLPHPDAGEGWVPYGDSGRAGILAHGSVLASFSKFSDTSPTQRGIFVQRRLLCNNIGSPPANVDVDQPPGDASAVCKEARYLEHRQIASCAGCHDQIDPIGFGLENYDIGGVWRDSDDGRPECAISGQGEVPGFGSFSGPRELGEILVTRGLLEACAIEHYLRFVLGREVQAGESGLLDSVEQGFLASNYDLKQLIVDYVASAAFALRKEPQ